MYFREKPRCVLCKKEIDKGEAALVELRYPAKKGFTEIQAYLQNEGTFYCASCAQKTRRQ